MNIYKIKIEKETEIYGIFFYSRKKVYIEAQNMSAAIEIIENILSKKENIIYIKMVNKLPRNTQIFIKTIDETKN